MIQFSDAIAIVIAIVGAPEPATSSAGHRALIRKS
jgi:hypothetical protein